MAPQTSLPMTPQTPLFGLTALTGVGAESTDYDGTAPPPAVNSLPQTPSSDFAQGLDTPTLGSPAPTAPQLLDLPSVPVSTPLSPDPWSPSPRGTTPSSPPPAAASASGRGSPPSASTTPPPPGRPAKAALAPLSTSLTQQPRTTSMRAMQALVNPPSPSAGRRLPPITNSGAAGGGSGNGRKLRSSASGGAAGGGASMPSSPERAAAQRPAQPPQAPVSTPQSNVSRLAAAPPAVDPRVFDGKDLADLVKVSAEDYIDVPRLQRIITLALGGKTTEAAKASALLQIREASIQNPLFSLTPAMFDLVREALQSRNRLLRPAAAYALAGYAANSRAGRGLMAVNATDLLPRLNAMLRCRVDSMDARYASLAILTASMHNENKESVGRSGSIPLLINLLRQNLGRHHLSGFGAGEAGLEHVLSVFGGASVPHSSAAGTTSAGDEEFDGDGSGGAGSEAGAAAAAAGHDGTDAGGAHAAAHAHDAASHAGGDTSDGAAAPPGGAFGSGSGGGGRRRRWISEMSSVGGGTESGGAGPLARDKDSQKGMYVLSVKPAGAHAAAALVNLAELPANRQRMRGAGIALLLEEVLASRNENPIKERCRLLVDFLQMDTQRFKQAKAASDAATVALAAHAAVAFHRNANQALRAAGMTTAAAAGITTAAGAPTLSGGVLNGSSAWKLARQLEKGEHEEEAHRNAAAAAAAGGGGGGGGSGGSGKPAGMESPAAQGQAPLGRLVSQPRRPGAAESGGGGGGGASIVTTQVTTTVDAAA